jgi:ABC-type branched-subunit amino acid transport system ATPase component
VENNLKTAMIVRTLGKDKIDKKTQKEKLEYILDLTKLQAWRNVPAAALTHANQRRLMMGNALATFPKLLMLDEIVAGMSGEEQNETQQMVQKVNKDGTTVLMIEHNMRIAMTTANRIVAINFGHKIAEGPPKKISRNEKVIEAYLGSEEKYA